MDGIQERAEIVKRVEHQQVIAARDDHSLELVGMTAMEFGLEIDNDEPSRNVIVQ